MDTHKTVRINSCRLTHTRIFMVFDPVIYNVLKYHGSAPCQDSGDKIKIFPERGNQQGHNASHQTSARALPYGRCIRIAER